ncbi:MAG: amidohydrolase family protein [Coriobacteriia bacterium]
MLVTADWVLPISEAPIPHGGVLVRGSRITAVGPADEIVRAHPKEPVTHRPGCALLPGLVDAHTHLSLSAMADVVGRLPFPDWLARVVRGVRILEPDDMAASVALGVHDCLRGGITAVGDVAYGPEPLATAADAGVAGVFFWEVLGISESEFVFTLAEREFPTASGGRCDGRTRCGISPHSVYTAGPGLLRATHRLSRENGLPFSLHVAESLAEMDLLVRGGGALAGVASRLAFGFRPPITSPVRYLSRLGVLEGTLAVHCVHLIKGDAHLLAQQSAGVVLCPRSNAFLGNGAPPVAELIEAGALVALGTDSAASNDGLDLFEEARALRSLEPGLTPRDVLRMMTADGAKALGLDEDFGTLEPKKQADIVAVRVGKTRDPESALVEMGGKETVDSVMTAGLWRVLGARPVFETLETERAASKVTEKVAAELRA